MFPNISVSEIKIIIFYKKKTAMACKIAWTMAVD
jgi:hypothetical protein